MACMNTSRDIGHALEYNIIYLTIGPAGRMVEHMTHHQQLNKSRGRRQLLQRII